MCEAWTRWQGGGRRVVGAWGAHLQQLEVELAPQHGAQVSRRRLVEADARHGRVVLGRRGGRVEQLGARLERALQVEAVDAEHAVHRHVALRAARDRRERVDAAQPRLDALQVGRRDQVGLVEQQPVGERYLR